MANRVLLGKHDSLGYGLFVSKPNKDAKSATGDDLIFNSDTNYGGGQIHSVHNVTIPVGGTGTAAITGLAYIPHVHVTEYSGTTTKGVPSWWGRVDGTGSCILEGSMIKTPQGEVPIEELKIGDTIIGYDLENNKEVETYIMEQSAHRAQFYYKVNDLRITAGHPIWTERGWSVIEPDEYYHECKVYGNEKPPVDVRRLEIGDKMLNSSVEKIERISCDIPVYNIEVNKFHNYIADNILVHNGGGMMGGGGGGGGGGAGGGKGRAQIRWGEFRVRVTSSQVSIFGAGDTSASSGDSMNYIVSHHTQYPLTYPGSIVGKTYKVIVYRIKANF